MAVVCNPKLNPEICYPAPQTIVPLETMQKLGEVHFKIIKKVFEAAANNVKVKLDVLEWLINKSSEYSKS